MKCKFCNKEIDCLVNEATATTGISMDKTGEIIWDDDNMKHIAEFNEWRCPECDEVIAWDEDEARKFVLGEEK